MNMKAFDSAITDEWKAGALRTIAAENVQRHELVVAIHESERIATAPDFGPTIPAEAYEVWLTAVALLVKTDPALAFDNIERLMKEGHRYFTPQETFLDHYDDLEKVDPKRAMLNLVNILDDPGSPSEKRQHVYERMEKTTHCLFGQDQTSTVNIIQNIAHGARSSETRKEMTKLLAELAFSMPTTTDLKSKQYESKKGAWRSVIILSEPGTVEEDTALIHYTNMLDRAGEDQTSATAQDVGTLINQLSGREEKKHAVTELTADWDKRRNTLKASGKMDQAIEIARIAANESATRTDWEKHVVGAWEHDVKEVFKASPKEALALAHVAYGMADEWGGMIAHRSLELLKELSKDQTSCPIRGRTAPLVYG